MNNHISRSRPRAFTLVELLAVVAVIAILSALLVPAVGFMMEGARKSAAQSNLRQIAMAYSAYSSQTGQPRSISADTIYNWALTLAREINLNEAGLFILSEDPLVIQNADTPPQSVAFPIDGVWKLNGDFDGYPLSFAVVSGILPDSAPSTTPIAWTRGLQTDGTWASLNDTNPGVYGDEGGHIVYLDGHVVWYPDLLGPDGNGVLVNYLTKQPTPNITEALPPGATALDHTGPLFGP